MSTDRNLSTRHAPHVPKIHVARIANGFEAVAFEHVYLVSGVPSKIDNVMSSQDSEIGAQLYPMTVRPINTVDYSVGTN